MKHFLLPLAAVVALSLAAPLPADARTFTFPDQLTADHDRLVKVGEGSFRWFFIRVYDGVLYLDEAAPGADPLADVAKRLELAYAVDISADDFRQSGDDILRQTLDAAAWEQLQPRLSTLNAAYRAVQKGDRYSLTYIPGKGTTLALNGEPLVTIEGADFARAYFSIWLGENAVKSSFREDLLGK